MIDIAIIIFYFIVVLWIGIRSGRKIQGIREFSIGNRNFSVTVLVATLSGTLIGGGATFGMAEKVFSVGLIFFIAYCGILIERILTSVFIADKIEPFFGMISAGDIMEKLYGKIAKILTGIATVTTSIFILGAHITTMGFILESFLGMPLTLSLGLSTISMLIYSGYGGISAVSFTDVVQFAFMLISIPLVALISLMDVGGFQAIASSVPRSYLYLSDIDGETLWRHSIVFISYSLPALYPVIIQRMLMARNTKQIKLSLWFNAALSLFFFTMIALIGLVAFVKNPQLDPKQAFPSLILNSLPTGIRGLVIVGLLATVMSTVDSFLNLISVSFTNDVLQPLTKFQLTSKQQLKIARFITVIIGITGFISALFFNGILENIFASMNLWLPFIFPPMFFGIMRNRGSQSSFLAGIALAAATLTVARLLGFADSFFPTILAATANSVALLVISKKSNQKQYYLCQLDELQQKTVAALYNICQEVKATLTSNLLISDILGVFTISFTTLPIIASAGSGAKPGLIPIAISFSIAIAAVFFILKDLWIKRPTISVLSYCLPLFIAISQITQPLINLMANEFSSLSIVNLLIGMAILLILYQGTPGIIWCIIGIFIAAIFMIVSSTAVNAYGAIPQAIEVTIRLLAMVYFVLHFRKQDHNRLEKFNSLTGVLAHEVGHSIISMNFCAHRLRIALPVLLDAYRNKSNVGTENPISHSDLLALEELSDRLKENASRTKSTIQILQTKILTDSMPLEAAEVSISSLIQEAIKSGVKESLNSDAHIKVSGEDFAIVAEKGPIVHVFINLLKNSLEALQGIPHPRIDIAIQAEQNTILITDNGCGISHDAMRRIFKENFSTKKAGRGKGLHFCRMMLVS